MEKRKKKSVGEKFSSVEVALSNAENIIEKNKNILYYSITGILVAVLLVIAYINFIHKPKAEEAYSVSFKAEYYFEKDSFNIALNGDGAYPGFLEIIDEYGSTKMGKLSKYYAGVCYLKLGNFEEALEVLSGFSTKDPIIDAMAMNLIGDVNMELGNQEEAVKSYVKAVKRANNEILSPIFLMKAGRTYEILGQYNKALEVYNQINSEYYNSPEQRNIEKYIKRAEINL